MVIVYLPNGNIDAFEEYISDITSRFTNIVILGDFNCDISSSSKYPKLKDPKHKDKKTVLW